MPLNIGSRSTYEATVNATATSIEGTWFPPFNQLSGILGATRKFQLTDKGKAVQAEKRQIDLTQRDCIRIGEPTVMLYPVANTIKVQKDRVTIETDWMDTNRAVSSRPRASGGDPDVPARPLDRQVGGQGAGRRDHQLQGTRTRSVDVDALEHAEEAD